jgi:hypothetical protein
VSERVRPAQLTKSPPARSTDKNAPRRPPCRSVELARGATAVFNAIDVGPMWDFCVNSLCKALGLPYAAAQSFDWRLEVERQSRVSRFSVPLCLSGSVGCAGWVLKRGVGGPTDMSRL